MPAGAALLPADSCAEQAKASSETDPTAPAIAMATLPPRAAAPAPDAADIVDHAELGVRLPPRPARPARTIGGLVRALGPHCACALSATVFVLVVVGLIPAALLTHRPDRPAARAPFDPERLYVPLPPADQVHAPPPRCACSQHAVNPRRAIAATATGTDWLRGHRPLALTDSLTHYSLTSAQEVTVVAHGSCAHQAKEGRFWRQLSAIRPQERRCS